MSAPEELPPPSWRDPEHPLFKEFEEAFRAAFPEDPEPPVVPLAPLRGIARAIERVAHPGVVGYEGQKEVLDVLEAAGFRVECVHGGPFTPDHRVCKRLTRRCPVNHRIL